MGRGAALGAGALGGAALAQHRRKSSSHSRSPHRHSLLASKDRADNSDSSNGKEYSDALPNQLHNVPIGEPTPPEESSIARDLHSGPGPHDLPGHGYDIPPTPPTRSRRNSALGTAAPSAAAAAYIAHPHSRSRSHSRSTSADRAPMPPALPSRSPHRSSFPGNRSSVRHSSPLRGEPVFNDGPGSKGIVGDNGYPHMGVPRRKSGGADDYAAVPPATGTVGDSRYPAHMAGSNETSDDST